MLLTVAIPTYRRGALLAELLSAMAAQLPADAELLVIDNDPDESARGIVATVPSARYVAEPARGVVNARNRAVREARGDWLAFVDDDELPRPGWAEAVLAEIAAGSDASFGMVIPRFESPVPGGLERMLEDLYTRDLKRPAGADVSDLWAHVGTGNSLFRCATCFTDPAPFNLSFNASGGEDVNFIRGLLARGVTLRWMPDAVVEEIVPADRAALGYVRLRKFSHGQQRVIFVRGRGGVAGNARTCLWMGVGALQVAGYGGHCLWLRLTGSPRWREALVRMTGGLGKLLWWRPPPARYG